VSTLPHVIDDSWHADAACAEADPSLFFDSDGEAAQQAMAMCAVCPVRTTCLRSALELGEMHGIWGGTTESERRRMIRDRRRRARQRGAA
jgi:hypothetical protein